jgi:Putative peptidoglycan binding domain
MASKLVSASVVTIYETPAILRCVIYGQPKKSMNKKAILLLSALAAVALAVPLAMADPRSGRSGGNGHFGRAPTRGAFAMTRGGAGTFRQGGFNHRGHFHGGDRFIFFGGFGFPYYYGYPYYGYSYGYGYPYGYSTPYGYDYDNYSEPAYGYDYRDRSRGGSSVVTLQRQLAQAGYYRGAIDGIMGPETRRAMRAYQRSRGALSDR